MKALVKRKSEPGLWLEEVPKPSIGLNDVLIRIDRTGICGTDVHIYKWDEWARKTIPVPMVVGHEFVGEIVEVGSNDGIVLNLLKEDARVLGVDPATNVVLRALRRGLPTMSDFFSERLARQIGSRRRSAKRCWSGLTAQRAGAGVSRSRERARPTRRHSSTGCLARRRRASSS